jgi:hypothetical protein
MSARTERENWPAVELQARQICAALNETPWPVGWVLEDASGSPEEYHCWRLRRKFPDDLRLSLDWPEAWRKADRARGPRITVSLVWPTDAKHSPRVIRTPYGQKDPITEITIDAGKPAAQIAADIMRRLVLKDGERLHAEAVRLIMAADVAQQAQQATVRAILAAEPGSRTSPNSGDSVIYLGAGSHGYTVRVDSDTSVRFEPFTVDLPVALRILEALHKPAPQCPAHSDGYECDGIAGHAGDHFITLGDTETRTWSEAPQS